MRAFMSEITDGSDGYEAESYPNFALTEARRILAETEAEKHGEGYLYYDCIGASHYVPGREVMIAGYRDLSTLSARYNTSGEIMADALTNILPELDWLGIQAHENCHSLELCAMYQRNLVELTRIGA